MAAPLPGRPAPDLELPVVGGDTWRLKDQTPDTFTLMVFYRGLHCPICAKNLKELDQKISEFTRRGVNAVAVSCDSKARADKSRAEWGINDVPMLYDMSIEEASAWDLYLSKAVKDGEPDMFSEPAVFLIQPDKTVYSAWIQSTPFARPGYDDILSAIDYITENDYPPRGSVER